MRTLHLSPGRCAGHWEAMGVGGQVGGGAEVLPRQVSFQLQNAWIPVWSHHQTASRGVDADT